MWERTLQDLIRGLRANKKDEAKFIAKAVDEIRDEVRGKDMELKAGAVLKLTYLDMLGYDMSWASFHVVEVMSSPRIHLKSIGYLAAGLSFHEDTDVLMLTTNSLKKDLNSRAEDVAVTLNGFSQIVNADLARDLGPEVIRLLTHSRPHIRKRAIIALYRVLDKHPGLREQAVPRLRERLEDDDPGVVAAAVNVLCELARKNPTDYLALAPQLFHLLTTSSNNWMLIKLIKLFGSLTPHEPRLVKKLQPPITDLISTTPAVSLLYECVHTCIIGGMLHGSQGNALARTCVTKLANFLQDSDQNLKYIALMALVKIVPSHPYLVAEYQEMIMSSVNDHDISIRMRALDLISAMANNLQSIVQQLLSHLARNESNGLPSAVQSLSQYSQGPSTPGIVTLNNPSMNPAYRLTLAQRILILCSQDTYESVTDFEWYLSVLVDLAYIANVDVGEQIRDQLVDVAARVRGVRGYAVQLMTKLLSDDSFLLNAGEGGSCSEVLWAAAWICGEYCSELAEPQKLLNYLLQPKVLTLPPEIVSVYLQGALKVFGSWAAELAEQWDDESLPKVKITVNTVLERIRDFASNADIEVQERAANIQGLFSFVNADLQAFHPKSTSNDIDYGEDSSSGFGVETPSVEPRFPKGLFLVHPLFSTYELNPVAASAQASVPIPDGLDLDAWIVPPPKEETEEAGGADGGADVVKVRKAKKGKGKAGIGGKTKKQKQVDLYEEEDVLSAPVETEEEKAERERVSFCFSRKQERLERQRDDPFYLTDSRQPAQGPTQDDVDLIPVVRLDDLPGLSEGSSASASRLPTLKSASKPRPPQAFVIDRVGEMPKGAKPPSLFSSPSSARSPPLSNGSGGTPVASTPSFFPQYEVEDDIPRTGTPPPIKVTRTKKKKKGTGTGTKKSRTSSVVPVDNT
ncbi:Ap3d1 protein [Irpex rosettiformis]|uniref:Ap3d1 protein n=1 Tax=Irpex rosettiformis TaxID=378272 RepID=A0ACB8UJV3_9APHY|nr:Ap3d1 protein [Irpex rosettiformis]